MLWWDWIFYRKSGGSDVKSGVDGGSTTSPPSFKHQTIFTRLIYRLYRILNI